MALFKSLKVLKNLTKLADKGLDIAQEAVIDKDKQIELKATLQTLRAQLLLGGKGASITKVTISVLVSALVAIGILKFWFSPADMVNYKDMLLSVTPLLGILIGAYGTGAMFKRSKWSNL